AKDGGNAVRLSGTISADRQGWWKCSKIVWNNLCPRTKVVPRISVVVLVRGTHPTSKVILRISAVFSL
ncbi:MAG: hypothetical protein HFP77_00775, partial [Methylococcales symbiont of Iophon sp. n. MRB-2018]